MPTPAGMPRIDLQGVEEAVGATSFGRGRAYARRNRVLRLAWDGETTTLSGRVTGRGGVYTTAAYFSGESLEPLEFGDGDCTCPIGWNCKHVAAIVVAATDRDAAPATSAAPSPPLPRASAWELSLRAMIDAATPQSTGNPVAIELALRTQGDQPRLMARLMRLGARGTWISGSLTWDGLEWQSYDARLRPDHVALARELYATDQARRGRLGSYSSGQAKTLDLGAFESPQLWPLLDEATRIGLKLIHAKAGLGEIRRPSRGEVVLDVRRGEDGPRLTAGLRIDGLDEHGLQPLLFVSPAGHGVVCVGPDDRLRLVRLAKPAPAPLRQLIVSGEELAVPAADEARFAEELWPALRHLATIGSSDDSFTPPEISAPTLVLRADHGADHKLEASWAWAYRVNGATRRVALDAADGPAFRDLDAERVLLADTLLEDTGLQAFGLLDAAGRPAAGPPVVLRGLSSMRLCTEALPRLAERTDVAVATTGQPADYRDLSGAVQLGLSTATIDGDRDWFGLHVTISAGERELEFAEVFAALAGGDEHVLLDDGGHFSLLDPQLRSLRRLIEEARGLTDDPSGALRISRYQAGLWAELASLGVVHEQAEAWQRQVGALLMLDHASEHPLPATIDAQLRPYQREGFGWLASLWELEIGGILADDMGLGKTLQTLAMICHARELHPTVRPFLVVAPTSVVGNWSTEAARFAPSLRVTAVTDTLKRAGRVIDAIAAGADVVVTTYTLLRLDADAYQAVPWAGLVLDEAQFVKNHKSKTYRCVRELDTPFKLAITGTPMENNLMELWALLSITAPGLFPDPKHFAEQYAKPIERGSDDDALPRLRRRIKPLVKRRTKELVAADLPAKQEQVLDIELHPRHRKLYDTHLQRERQKILGLLADFDRNRFTILRSITLLRQLSLHPGLVDDAHDGIPAAKIEALIAQLGDVVGGGHRALVFSQFTGFLAKVRDHLDAAQISYSYLDGRTRNRPKVVERFKTGTDSVFLISLKAGGSGLNLTEADYCFLLDPWWNPATEAQAIDRTHRIGQTRPVMVYRMVASGTIEEKVVALSQRKAKLFRGVMDDGDLFASAITPEDIRGLLA